MGGAEEAAALAALHARVGGVALLESAEARVIQFADTGPIEEVDLEVILFAPAR
jgi:hypothetical protein